MECLWDFFPYGFDVDLLKVNLAFWLCVLGLMVSPVILDIVLFSKQISTEIVYPIVYESELYA